MVAITYAAMNVVLVTTFVTSDMLGFESYAAVLRELKDRVWGAWRSVWAAWCDCGLDGARCLPAAHIVYIEERRRTGLVNWRKQVEVG